MLEEWNGARKTRGEFVQSSPAPVALARRNPIAHGEKSERRFGLDLTRRCGYKDRAVYLTRSMHIQLMADRRERCIGDALSVAAFLCARTSMAKIDAKMNEHPLDRIAAAARGGAVEGRIS